VSKNICMAKKNLTMRRDSKALNKMCFHMSLKLSYVIHRAASCPDIPEILKLS